MYEIHRFPFVIEYFFCKQIHCRTPGHRKEKPVLPKTKGLVLLIPVLLNNTWLLFRSTNKPLCPNIGLHAQGATISSHLSEKQTVLTRQLSDDDFESVVASRRSEMYILEVT